MNVELTKTLPWLASVLRIHMKGPMDWISTVVEEGGAYAEDGVAVTDDAAIGEVDGAAEVESVA